MPRYSDKQLEAALRESRGMLYVAARRLGCDPATVRTRVEKSERLRAVVEAERGLLGDTAELKLIEAIRNGEPWAIQFYLKTQHRDRGYVDRQEVSGPDGGPIRQERITRIVIEAPALEDRDAEPEPPMDAEITVRELPKP